LELKFQLGCGICFRGLVRITPNRRRCDSRPNCNVIRLVDRGADLVRSNPHACWRRQSSKPLMVWRWWNYSRCGKDERFLSRGVRCEHLKWRLWPGAEETYGSANEPLHVALAPCCAQREDCKTSDNSENSHVSLVTTGISIRFFQYIVPIILPPVLGVITGRTGQPKFQEIHTRMYSGAYRLKPLPLP